MPRRTLLVLLLTAGLLGPAETVICTESDGRVGVELGIGGRCADLVIKKGSEEPVLECPSCSDSLLPSVGATVERKGQLPEVALAHPVVGASASRGAPLADPGVAAVLLWYPPPRQHDPIRSVVLLL